MIQLANQVHSNLWVNVPFHATDDYVRQLATLLKNTLDPSLSIYLEFSNEVWNTAFEQGASNTAAALAEVQAGVKSGHPSDLNYDNQPVDLSQTKPNTGEVITWADRRTARRLHPDQQHLQERLDRRGPAQPDRHHASARSSAARGRCSAASPTC